MNAFMKIVKIVSGILLGLLFSFLTIVALDAVLPASNPFGKHTLNLWWVGAVIAAWLFFMLWLLLRRSAASNKLYTPGIDRLPLSAAALIDAVIDAMGYRKSVRADVRQELTDHFTDALADCGNEAEKQQRISELIDAFGEPQLLGTLLRRAKKRCRPLWRTLAVRAFQLLGICFLLLIVHFIRLSFADPNIEINYAQKTTQLSRLVTDESKNAAVFYQKAIALYQPPEALFDEDTTLEVKTLDTDLWVDELSAEENTLLAQWYAGNAQAYTELFKGTELPYCWWDYDNDQMILSMKPQYGPLRQLWILQFRQAKQEAAAGDYAAAFDRLHKSYRFGMHLKGPKTLIDQLVGISIQTHAMQASRQIMAHCRVPGETLAAFRKTLLDVYEDDTFVAHLETEKFALLDLLQRSYTDNGQGQGVLIPRQLVQINREFNYLDALEVPVISQGVSYGASLVCADRKSMRQEIEQLYEKLNAYVRLSPFEIRQQGIDDPVDEMWRERSKFYYVRYWPLFIFTPAISKVGELTYRARCDVQATITLAAVMQYHQAQGRYPDTLEQLVQDQLIPRVPADPYSGAGLVYRRTQDGFTLYSVGDNFADDGGIPATTDGERPSFWGENGDTVFWPVSREN